MGANRLQDELLRLASRIGAVEDERDRLKVQLGAERDALWLRDEEIRRLKAELAAFPLLPKESDGQVRAIHESPLQTPLAGEEQGADEVQTLVRYPY